MNRGLTCCQLFYTALIYLGTFLLSLTYWILDCMRKKAVAALSGNDSRKKQGNYGAVSLNE